MPLLCNQHNVGIPTTSLTGEVSESDGIKCSLCQKRLGRKNCLQSACIQCCKDPKCEPHREAREALRKNKSILDGTDAITRMATKKRNSKVAKGSFHDDNIQYFGETVVIWNIREFMNVTKWREDAMRRSKRKLDDSTGTIIGRGKKQGRNDSHGTNNKPKQLRRKKFSEVCQLLLQNSLK